MTWVWRGGFGRLCGIIAVVMVDRRVERMQRPKMKEREKKKERGYKRYKRYKRCAPSVHLSEAIGCST
jgi:hypothetical protein